jgi:hypothetical protein
MRPAPIPSTNRPKNAIAIKAYLYQHYEDVRTVRVLHLVDPLQAYEAPGGDDLADTSQSENE